MTHAPTIHPAGCSRPARPADRPRVRRTVAAGLFSAVLLAVWLCPSAEAQDSGDRGIVITGEVLAPEVTIFVTRDNLLKDYNIVFEESFLEKIVESIEKPPF